MEPHPSSLPAVAEIVEERYAIGFSPQPHFAGGGETLIGCLDDFLAIKGDGELCCFGRRADP